MARPVRAGPRAGGLLGAHGGVRRDGDGGVGTRGRGVAGDGLAAVEAAHVLVQRQRLLRPRQRRRAPAAELVRELRAPHPPYRDRVRHPRPHRGPGRRAQPHRLGVEGRRRVRPRAAPRHRFRRRARGRRGRPRRGPGDAHRALRCLRAGGACPGPWRRRSGLYRKEAGRLPGGLLAAGNRRCDREWEPGESDTAYCRWSALLGKPGRADDTSFPRSSRGVEVCSRPGPAARARR